MSDHREQVLISSRAEWRAWLADHHASSPGIWLITWKKGHGPYVAYDEVVEEALCFGWVDSRPRVVDAEHSSRLLTPRRSASNWSRVNRERVDRLTRAGLMAPAGLAVVDAAQRNGTWSALDEVEALLEPEDLRALLDLRPQARSHWDAFPRSAKRAILEWIGAAKTEGTRTRRIATTVSEAALNRRANQWRQP